MKGRHQRCETSIKRFRRAGRNLVHRDCCTANRLASNSLIEAVVYADRCTAHGSIKSLEKVDFQEGIPGLGIEGTQHTEEMLMIIQSKREMQTIMSNYGHRAASNLSLKRAMHRWILWQRPSGALQEQDRQAQPRVVRTAEHDRHRLSGHQAGREIKESSWAATTTPITPRNNT